MLQRISKFLSHAGVCSRRQAEQLISEGQIKVDGQVLLSPATLVHQNSHIEVNGKIISHTFVTRIWLYYKPVGYLTTNHDPQGRLTIFDDLRSYNLPRLITVGRLDLNSEGLLLLTTNGTFARQAELPKTNWPRCYKVRVFGEININSLKALEKGPIIEGIRYKPIPVEILNSSHSQKNKWLKVTLFEGKNREIRKIMNHLGLQVNRLIRVSYGPFHLDSLTPHQIKEVSSTQVENVCDRLDILSNNFEKS